VFGISPPDAERAGGAELARTFFQRSTTVAREEDRIRGRGRVPRLLISTSSAHGTRRRMSESKPPAVRRSRVGGLVALETLCLRPCGLVHSEMIDIAGDAVAGAVVQPAKRLGPARGRMSVGAPGRSGCCSTTVPPFVMKREDIAVEIAQHPLLMGMRMQGRSWELTFLAPASIRPPIMPLIDSTLFVASCSAMRTYLVGVYPLWHV